MAKPPYGNQSDRDRSNCDTHESLEALARLLALQLAREHFAGSGQQSQANDQSNSAEIWSKENE